MNNYSYEYPHPGLTADIVLFRYLDETLQILLIERGDYPYEGSWALPGGFVDEGETAEDAAVRELLEETGIQNVDLEQIYTATTPGRDPRGWTVSVIFVGFVFGDVVAIAGDDARNAYWFPVGQIPKLAFDHHEAIKKTMDKIYEQALFKVFGPEVLKPSFSLKELTRLYEQINLNGKQISQLAKKLIHYKILRKEGGFYRFSGKVIKKVLSEGFIYD